MVSALLAALHRHSDDHPTISEMLCHAMHKAGGEGDWDVLKLLMLSNITSILDPKVLGNGLALALMSAASQGHGYCVERILEFDAQQTNKKYRLESFLAPRVCDSFSRYSA